MKRLLFLPFTAVLLSSALSAQSADADIERTLLAAPASLRAEATILELRPDGSTAVLRGGSNGLICWDNEGRPGQRAPLDVQCTAEANRPRLEQNHAFESAGETVAEILSRPSPHSPLNRMPLELEGLTLEEIWDVDRASGRDVPLREFIDDALAVYIRPHAFSHRELILAVAQQTGSAHEDETVEVALVRLEQFLIGGFSGYGGPMSGAAEHALRAGGRLLDHLGIYIVE